MKYALAVFLCLFTELRNLKKILDQILIFQMFSDEINSKFFCTPVIVYSPALLLPK